VTRRNGLIVSAIATIGLLLAMSPADERMQDTGGPGIVPFELTGGQDRADEFLAEWGDEGRDAARESLWIDFGFLLAYGTFLTLALAAVRDLARERGWPRLAAIGRVVVSFGALGAAFDALENACLLLTLEDAGAALPLLATVFAACKFGLLALAIGYLLAVLATRLRRGPVAAVTALVAISLLAASCGGGSDESDEPGEQFEPQASLIAIGGTARTDKPAVVMRVEARPADANIRSATVTLPSAFFVDQTALGNLCSERELEVDDCAGRKRMGMARVVSPAYGEALTGPVYAVSGSGGLPRLAYVLEGPAKILLRGRIEVLRARIQAGVDDVPDTPLKSFELRIDGGRPGYLVLSRDICRTRATADASFTSQDGEAFKQRIPLVADCGA
jgi:hypothetical protein